LDCEESGKELTAPEQLEAEALVGAVNKTSENSKTVASCLIFVMTSEEMYPYN
jgi:hypothetical protein